MDLYGAAMRLSFLQRVRDERAFDGVEALKAQIAADCDRARELFRQISV
jgi:riboflavin kinase/FMN adenylyltransferase